MSNIMTYKGYSARIEYIDDEDAILLDIWQGLKILSDFMPNRSLNCVQHLKAP